MTPFNPLPYLPFFYGDYLTEVTAAGLTFMERGIYMQLLAMEAQNGPHPADIQEIARRLGIPVRFARRVIDQFFPLAPDGTSRINIRLERCRDEAQKRHRAAVDNGAKGGRKAREIRESRSLCSEFESGSAASSGATSNDAG